MKKVFNILLVLTFLLPTILFVGCGKDNSALSVKNSIFYITKATCKGADISKPYTDAHMKIVFQEETFIVEYSESGKEDYGYYLGTFTINDNIINFTITEAGGTYSNYENDKDKQISVFTSLRYQKKKLYTEFAKNAAIYSFTLETKSK